MVAPLRVLFFGTPDFAVPTLDAIIRSRHLVVTVVTQPDRPRGRGHRVTSAPVKARADALGLPVLQPDRLRDPAVETAFRAVSPDIGVVVAYGKLIPESLINVPRLGMINVHGSLLPRYRGAAPVHRAVMAGDAETGITIMRVIRELDAGAMFATARRPIGPDDTSDQVERDLAQMGAALLVTVLDELAEGRATEVPQDDQRATYAPRLQKDEGRIDWTETAETIHNKVRGLQPWPHAFTQLEGERIILLQTRLGAPVTSAPGTVVRAGSEGIVVAAGSGRALVIERLQREGRRPVDAREFLAGRAIPEGTRLGP